MNTLIEELGRHTYISEELLHLIENKSERRIVKPRRTLLVPNQEQENIYFVIVGILRTYYQLDDKEWTSRFFQPGHFVLSIDNFLFDLPCKEFIETCTPVELIVVKKHDYLQLLKDFPELLVVARNIADERLRESNDRMYSWRMMSAAERYDQFRKEYPDLIKHVQSKHIASYLDISQYHLSRIRNRAKAVPANL